jgi:glutamine amidotransferase
MCQLLGMNCNVPTDICFSFEGFRARGGKTDEHKDGWGIAFFEDRGCRLFLDDQASVKSPIAEVIKAYPIRSLNVIAHIRKATQGKISLQNTHPFMREMWGRYWLFAHNGDLKGFQPRLAGRYQPVGDTDSELAFCYILQELSQAFSCMPPLNEMSAMVRHLAQNIAEHGTFNFLMSNGESLLAHCSTDLHYIIRRAPFRSAHLLDEDVTIDFSEVTTPNDIVAVIATLPLTDNETWVRMETGQLLTFCSGEPMNY